VIRTIAIEAADEPEEGKAAVAHVISIGSEPADGAIASGMGQMPDPTAGGDALPQS